MGAARGRGLAICHLAGILAGGGAAMLGPLLPVLARTWGLTDASAGLLPACEFAGGFCGAIATRRLGATQATAALLAEGIGLLAFGLAGAATMSRTGMPVFLFVCGVGLGFINPSANLIVARSASPAAALNLFGFSWASGALAAPFAIALALRRQNPGTVFAEFSILAAAASLLALSYREGEATGAASFPPATRARAFVLITGLALFLYVGVETSLSVWLPTCTARWTSVTGAEAAAAQSAFWASLLMGRLMAPVWLRRLMPHLLVLSGLLLAGTGIALVLAGWGYPAIMAGAVVAGFGLAPVNPTILALFTARLGETAKAWMGPVFAASGLGGAVIPWLVGAASSAAGSLRAGIAVTLACIAAMLFAAKEIRS